MSTPVYDRIKELCDQKGMALSTLESTLGLSKGSTQKWRKGSSPSTDSLIKIANYFHVSMDYLAGRTDTEETADAWMTDDDLISLQRAMLTVPKAKRRSVAEFLMNTFGDS